MDLAPDQSDTGGMDATHPTPLHHHSSTLAKTLEYKLLSEILAALLRRGVPDTEVFRPDVDQAGWDVGLEAHGVARHVQLKARVRGGKRGDVDLSLKLARKPSGCAIWFDYDPLTLALGPFRWFGNPPGQPLPLLGEKTAKHSKGNKDGDKAARPGHRVVRQSAFDTLATVEEVVDRLFGAALTGTGDEATPAADDGGEPNASAREAAHHELLVRHLRMRSREVPLDIRTPPAWLADAQEGRFESFPERLGSDEMLVLAHLMNGYELAEEAGLGHLQDVHSALTERASRTGTWTGTALELWLVIYGEHRRARQDGHSGPDRDLLGGAYSALRARLRPTR